MCNLTSYESSLFIPDDTSTTDSFHNIQYNLQEATAQVHILPSPSTPKHNCYCWWVLQVCLVSALTPVVLPGDQRTSSPASRTSPNLAFLEDEQEKGKLWGQQPQCLHISHSKADWEPPTHLAYSTSCSCPRYSLQTSSENQGSKDIFLLI